jgi:hypothetical protein
VASVSSVTLMASVPPVLSIHVIKNHILSIHISKIHILQAHVSIKYIPLAHKEDRTFTSVLRWPVERSAAPGPGNIKI